MKLNYLVAVLLSALLINTGCKNELDSEESITVKLALTNLSLGEGSDTPMNSKSLSLIKNTNSEQLYYAIQIYENDSAYYYGLFDNPDSLNIALTTNKTYKFKIAVLNAGTGTGFKQEINNENATLYLPNKIKLENKFIKGNLLNDINLKSSIKLNSGDKNYPEVDVFYCEKSILIEKGITSIDFNMKRMGFGITYNIDGLNNGKLNIIIGNDTNIILSPNQTAKSIRLFNSSDNNFTTIFNNADSFSDSIIIKVQWIGSNATQITTEKKYKFLRNYMKLVTILLNTTNQNLNFEEWNTETVTDEDGNTYKTVKIGSQLWMAENLKTTKYNDGSAIPMVSDQNQWANLSSGAYCFYNNLDSNKDIYGCLYNWHAVNTKKLAPKGWHIPTDEEWSTLTTFLGGMNIAGGKLKDTGLIYWNSPNTGASNETGFTALPSGHRGNNSGIYMELQLGGFWWTSTEIDYYYSYFRSIGYSSTGVGRNGSSRVNGLAVRCVKD